VATLGEAATEFEGPALGDAVAAAGVLATPFDVLVLLGLQPPNPAARTNAAVAAARTTAGRARGVVC
jgi:hypothetical protein